MKQKRFPKLFLLTMALLFLLSGCQLFGQETVWCLSERVTTINGETTLFQIRYDKDGKPLEYLRGPENALVQAGYCTYDEHGNLISYKDPYIGTSYTYDSRGNILSTSTQDLVFLYTYDAQNQMLSMERQSPEGKQLHLVIYSYDSKGNLIKESSCWSGGIPTEKQYTYDARGNMLSETYLENGQISKNLSSRRWEYDSNGNKLLEQYSRGSEFFDYLAYTYDSNGNVLSSSQYNSNGSCNHYFYTYDPAGNVISEIERHIDADGTIHEGSKFFYTYDEKGKLIKRQNFDAYGKESLFLWIYDENGNLLTESLNTPDFYYSYIRTYDRNNNLLTESFSGTRGKYEASYTYNAENQPLTFLQDAWGGGDIQENWEYDANGNLIRHESTFGGQTTVYTYTYIRVSLPAKQAQALRESQAEIWKQLHEGYLFAE